MGVPLADEKLMLSYNGGRGLRPFLPLVAEGVGRGPGGIRAKEAFSRCGRRSLNLKSLIMC